MEKNASLFGKSGGPGAEAPCGKLTDIAIEAMTIEIVDFPIDSMVMFHSILLTLPGRVSKVKPMHKLFESHEPSSSFETHWLNPTTIQHGAVQKRWLNR